MKKRSLIALILVFATLLATFSVMNASAAKLINFEPVMKDGKIYGIPLETTTKTLKYALYSYDVKVYDRNGKELSSSSSDYIGTGFKVKVNNVSFTAVVMGDINGDGKLNVFDYTAVKSAYLTTNKLTSIQHEACEAEYGEIKALNYVKLKRAYFGTYDMNKDFTCDPYDPSAEDSGWTPGWV